MAATETTHRQVTEAANGCDPSPGNRVTGHTKSAGSAPGSRVVLRDRNMRFV
jgi:hypothetical protein